MTARAVAAIAFGLPVGAVDVNVRRVIGRILGGEDGACADVQTVANGVAATTDPATWAHAVMDFGATVCRPRNPRVMRVRCGLPVVSPVTRPNGTNQPTSGRPVTPFPETNRWPRGRILDFVCEVDGRRGHPEQADDPSRIASTEAAGALARDGLVEVQRTSPKVVEARLAVA